MTEREFDGVTVQLVVGDITDQPDADAVVNAANAQLRPGGGVAGAIHRAAGPGLAEECRALAPISPGHSVMTGGHGLPNAHVIHTLGPVYGSDEPAAEFLASCYRAALRLAEDAGLGTVAFPAISTGIFGYPLRDAAAVALRTIAEAAPGLEAVDVVRFVLFDRPALEAHEEAMAQLTDSEL